MTTIQINAEDDLFDALQEIATAKSTSIEALVKELVINFLQQQPTPSKSYSFIGIGNSGQCSISKQADQSLQDAANRKEGWSLTE